MIGTMTGERWQPEKVSELVAVYPMRSRRG
jgi:hypothetical protein